MIGKYIIAASMLFATTNVTFAEGCKGGPKSEWRSVDEVKKAAIDNNFTDIVKVILEDGCYEVVTINSDGKVVGVHFDPVTLALQKVEDPR